MIKARIRTYILSSLAGLILFGASSIPALAHSIIGEGVDAAEQTDFYQFFHFKQVEKKALPNGETAASYSTGMQGFTVEWILILDKEQQIKSSMLFMPRDFVDSPQWGTFARDIAKSFLISTIPDSDRSQIVSLTHEISYAGLNSAGNSQVLIVNAGSFPTLPSTPSKGYLTYQGKQNLDEEAFSKSILKIENSDFGKGKPMIAFSISKN